MTEFDPQSCLEMVRDIMHPVAVERGNLPSTIVMYEDYGGVVDDQKRAFSVIFAWALLIEDDPWVRSEYVDALEALTVARDWTLGVPLPALMLAGEAVPGFLRTEDWQSEYEVLLAEVSRCGPTRDEILRSDAYLKFAAPHWISILVGLTGDLAENQNPKRSPWWRSPTAADRWSREHFRVLRERLVARRMLSHFVEHRRVDRLTSEVFVTVIGWLLESEPSASDAADNADLLELLRMSG